MKRTDVIILGCILCLLGVYVGRYVDMGAGLVLIGGLLVLTSKPGKLVFGVGIALVCMAIGNARGTSQNQGFEILRASFETKTTITGISLDDAEYNERGQLAFSITGVEIAGKKIPGQIAVSGFGEVSVMRGDRVEVTGKLFSARGSNQARVSFADLNVIQKDSQWYNALRRTFNKKLRDNLPEPLSSFAGGLLIGQRATIPDSIIANLRTTGLAHIIAVSGYNLTILVRYVMKVLKRLSRFQKLMTSFALIATFLLITGFSASIVRAAIVSGLSLLAWYYGRTFRPAVLLGATAVSTTLYRPEYIWGDAGWYLSFLAFIGILIISPLISFKVYGDKEPKMIGRLVIDTISVLIMVTPYSLLLFGNFSLVALLSNIAVVPLIPIAMALSVVCVFLPYSLAFLSIPARLVLELVLELARFFASLPHASINTKITLTEALGAYLVVLVVAYLAWRPSRRRLDTNFLIQ